MNTTNLHGTNHNEAIPEFCSTYVLSRTRNILRIIVCKVKHQPSRLQSCYKYFVN